jgi:hypothetical protein
MKLNEIKPQGIDGLQLQEGVIPAHLTMTLEQVVSGGKITNNVQTFIMADLVSFFKDAPQDRWPREANPYPMNAKADIIDAIKSLTEQEQVMMAEWLLGELAKVGTFEVRHACCDPQQSPVDWMRWVLKRQD